MINYSRRKCSCFFFFLCSKKCLFLLIAMKLVTSRNKSFRYRRIFIRLSAAAYCYNLRLLVESFNTRFARNVTSKNTIYIRCGDNVTIYRAFFAVDVSCINVFKTNSC